MSLPSAFASFCTAMLSIGNAALAVADADAMTEASELLSQAAEPYPSIRIHRMDEDLGLFESCLVQISLRVPDSLDEWTHMQMQKAITDGLNFKPGRQSPGRSYLPLFNYETSNNPSTPSGTLRLEIVGSKLWKSGRDGTDIKLYTCNLNIYF